MQLFQSSVANIHYFKDSQLIRTTWNRCETPEDFTPVILKVMEFYRLLLPKRTLWNQLNFSLNIPPELQQWTEENINIPAMRLNIFEKISFVVSKDTLSQMSVMEIFDETVCGFAPRYFTNEQESLSWLEAPLKTVETASTEPPKIIVDHLENKIRLSVEIESEEFNEYIYLFNKLWKAKVLSVDVAQRFMTLTRREKDLLRLLIRGKSNDFISDALSISPDTVRTHRKNIYRKLNCSRIEDLMKFSAFF